jgi:hypothetical protein
LNNGRIRFDHKYWHHPCLEKYKGDCVAVKYCEQTDKIEIAKYVVEDNGNYSTMPFSFANNRTAYLYANSLTY